mgnify:CR=1 FL=1
MIKQCRVSLSYRIAYVYIHLLIIPRRGFPPPKVVVVNYALNNLSPSLLSAFTDYLHSYGLVRLPFHVFCSRYPETDIPCSVIEPIFKSCRLYNGGRIASKQVSAILVSASFAQCDFARQLSDFVTSSAIHLHSSLKVIPDGFFPLHLFSIRSLQQLCSFCSVERFGNPACTALPILPNG